MAKKLVYVANNRLPTEKAHGLQIVQMCEALADAGYDLTLVTPRRFNTPEIKALDESLWAHYGVKQNFAFRRLLCVDLFPIFPRHHVAMLVQTFTYLLALLVWLLFRRVDVLYTRDMFLGFALVRLRPRTALVYEVHQRHKSRLGRRLQSAVVRRAFVVPITEHLAAEMRALGADRVLVAHDGIRAARFDRSPSREAARAALGIDPAAFVIGYVGRLVTMGMTKGLDTLVDAVARVHQDGVAVDLLVVGGPEEGIKTIREQWQARGLDSGRLHTVGQTSPDDVPRYLAAMDVGAMLLPWTEHFAYYASALKLFEYMAAGCIVLATDLPSTAEVVQDGETALLVPPGDIEALASAITRLYRDAALRARLAARAHEVVMARYTWQARATAIRQFVEE
jgi:glycosyltransferase involved in cell wall biosynthesis